ncbi:MAG: response regulator transcription factor [Anaerolineae bacterium]|nr:response regulator transcription factor [Anaerolineae bacterium]
MLRVRLQAEGYEVVSGCDGVAGLQSFQLHNPDLILLDVMMPRMNGWETCRRIRQLSDVPIIMLTAVNEELSTIRGLEMGADDYITKPFRFMELSARIRAVLRRRTQPITNGAAVKIDERLTVDQKCRRVIVAGEARELSPIEFKILSCFVENIGRVLTHQSLLTQVWGWEYINETDYLKVYIHHLRQKIEPNPQKPRYIITERGLGYRFQIP